MTVDVSAAELAASLRRVVAAYQRVGTENRWAPAPPAAPYWERAVAGEALSLTLTEADMHASLLVQSSLEHAIGVAGAILHRDAIAPHTLARTAMEHGLRAIHYLDAEASDELRATRRLNEWFYAIDEDQWTHDGLAESGLPTDAARKDYGELVEEVRDRALQIGLDYAAGNRRKDGNRRVGRLPSVGAETRASTMALAERYLAGDVRGLPQFLLRQHGPAEHGAEIGLLSSIASHDGPHGVNTATIAQMEPPLLAASLLAMPAAVISSVRSLAHRYVWPVTRAAEVAAREQERMMEVWRRATD